MSKHIENVVAISGQILTKQKELAALYESLNKAMTGASGIGEISAKVRNEVANIVASKIVRKAPAGGKTGRVPRTREEMSNDLYDVIKKSPARQTTLRDKVRINHQSLVELLNELKKAGKIYKSDDGFWNVT